MLDIFQSSLDARFAMIVTAIADELSSRENLYGLTDRRHAEAERLAEQAIINWAVASKNKSSRQRPLTNLQHLLAEYCAIADHL